MAGEDKRVEAYLATLARIEQDITPIDVGAFYASTAISLRRMADNSDKIIGILRAIEMNTRPTSI